MNRQTFAIARALDRRQTEKRVRMQYRSPGWPEPRTRADDLRDAPIPVDATPHVHFHGHGGRHAHTHVHPEPHGHSNRTDLPAHREVA